MKSILLTTLLLALGFTAYSQVKDIDGIEYKTVQIGEQEWMAENYAPTKFNNGDPIPIATSAEDWEKRTKKKEPLMCYLNFDESNKNEYGALYNVYAITDERGFIPEGWKIPSKSDWEKLGIQLGGNIDDYFILKNEQGASLKATSGWQVSRDDDSNGTNMSGFNAKPSGWIDVRFSEWTANTASFWSSSQGSKKKYQYYFSISASHSCRIVDGEKWVGQGIRLIKD